MEQFPKPIMLIGANGREYDAEEYFARGMGGWAPLVRQLIWDLVHMGWNRHLNQIKEKFGGLRFYTGSLTELQGARIRKAEREAKQTCIQCGSKEDVTTKTVGGWIQTLCAECYKKEEAYDEDE
jgi:hypothetical protein